MKLFREIYFLLVSALSDFARDKARTALTSLGIMIGVMSVVLLIALGLGLKNYIQEQFEGLGANLIMVMPGSGISGGGPAGMVGGVEFDEKDLNSLQKITGVKYTVPVFLQSTTIETSDTEKKGYVMGVNEEIFDLMSSTIYAGSLFGKTEVGKRTKIAVLGYSLADDLYEDPADALGKTIRVQNLRLKVIGVVEKTGDREGDRAVYLPYTTTFGSINPKKTFWSIYVGVPSDDDVELVKNDIESVLSKRYEEDAFSVTEQSEILSTLDQIFGVLNLVLVAIGSISLIVGGVGIMNIMYATVTERIKEIGIRRAIGATRKDILLMFITESMMLSILGGGAGLLASTIIVLVARIWFPVALNLLAVIIAFGVSSVIGVFFGVFPARRAAELSPIDAIRYE